MRQRLVRLGYRLDRLLEAGLDRALRPPADPLRGPAGVEHRPLDLPLARRRELRLEVIAAERATDQASELQDGGLHARADVDRAGIVAGLCRDQRRHDVPYIYVAAGLLSGPEDRGPPAVASEVTEDGDHAGLRGGILARAVDVPEPQDGGRQTTRAGIEVDIALRGELALPIYGEGRAAGRLGEGQLVGSL